MNAAPLAGPASHRQRLADLMAEVLHQHAQVRAAAQPAAVHDLRVALRRSLSVSATMRQLDAEAAWPQMHRQGRRLFGRLGRLRDAQVQAAWVQHFDPRHEGWTPLRLRLAEEEAAAQAEALAAVERWRRRRWRRWSEELPPRLDRVAAEPGFLLRLAVVQLGRAQALHRLPLGGDPGYHDLRIELKRLRYFLEAFLPEQHAALSAELKSVQDLLGEAHDLDDLEARLAAPLPGMGARRRERALAQIAAARQERFAGYAALSEAPERPLWPRWRALLLAAQAAAAPPAAAWRAKRGA